ncbi:glycosyltransferase family 2 protein [Puia sp. P3]|uniref:glycosyltransferase family 2 protein n=1 Tax=Puia sp. P3 TaxID=3423952 RepID=UPI003D67A24F
MSAIVKEMPSRHLPFSTPTPKPAFPATAPSMASDIAALKPPALRRGSTPRLKPGATTTPVSAVIITRNESRNIRRTLSRLYWCDEIVILDSHSTDETVEICREFGCRIFFRAFDGYGAQKRHAVALAKNDWILCVDADEVLSEELVGEIIQEMRYGPRCDAYKLPMNLVFPGPGISLRKGEPAPFPKAFQPEYRQFQRRRAP